ncbi:dihydrolipoyl dehydrogenase [Clostridium sp. DL1XJH146]
MATEIIMPKAGMDMEEGTIVKWFKKQGDYVETGEPILEIITDKVNMEVEAEVSGTLIEILAEPGQVLPVFKTIGYIGNKDEIVSEVITPKEDKLKDKKEINNEKFNYDVIVLGGGPAGYVAAIKASMLGGRVALVERIKVGGTCLNRGCIPTKTYIKNAETIQSIKHANDRGIVINDPSFTLDMKKIIDYKNKVVNKLTGGVAALLKSHGVKVYNGEGILLENKEVEIDGNNKISAKSIIFAGGSKVSKIPIRGIDSPLVMTSDEILDLDEVPKRLVIIGGGVIGVEIAEIFNAYGSDITIIELSDRILPLMDEEISITLTKMLGKKGIKTIVNTKLNKFEEDSNQLKCYLSDGQIIECDKALLSIGRVPDLSGTGNLDFEMDKGKIKVDKYMRTSIDGIYAPGDINGKLMLAHAAFKMGEVAAENAMGLNKEADLRFVPGCVYTLPEIGTVGLTEEIARQNHEVCIGKFKFAGNGRALASGETDGFVKVIGDKKYGEILGVHIIGPAAAEIINEAATLMAAEITLEEVADYVHGHPTYSEAFMEACADCLGKCIHLPKK